MANRNRSSIDRRSFLKTAAPFALGACTIARGQTLIERGRFDDDDLPLAQERLLQQVNAERANARLSRLQLDEQACRIANDHARDMAQHGFLSHWGSDGRKPYHRYSLAGGTDAVQENVSAAESIQSVTAAGVFKDLHDMHQSMADEAPPKDGHRRTILSPQHTHVGFGIAMQGHNLRLDELYLARYINVDPIPRELKPRSAVWLRGKTLNPTQVLTGIDVYSEPLPSPPAIDWLREPRSYALPQTFQTFLPRLPSLFSYPDGSTGNIDVNAAGRFQLRIGLASKPAINTIVVWLKSGANGTAFAASQICIRVD